MGQYYGKETGYVSEKEISTTKNRMIDEMIAEELKDEIIPEGDQEAARELCLEYGGNFGGSKNGGNSQFEHYLVDGAILQCYKAKKCGKWNRTTLHVSKNASQVNGRKMATVLDLDFEPFNIVCPLEETGGEERSCEELIWKAERWENMIRNTRYMTYCYGKDDNTVEEEGLTMLSMLLCKHGGIITPVDSDQKGGLIYIYQAEEGAVVSGKSGEKDAGAQAGVPVRYDFSTCLSFASVSLKTSPDYYLLHQEDIYIDSNGMIRMQKSSGCNAKDDFYCVAMAPGFITAAEKYCTPPKAGDINFGYTFQVCFKDEEERDYSIDVIVATEKKSTDRNDFYPHNSIVEFFWMEKSPMPVFRWEEM